MAAINWCFTINNYTSEDKLNLDQAVANGQAKYLVYQEERGENGTDHVQGYIQLTKRQRLSGVKRIVGERAHCEKAKGSPQQNKTYCTKPDTRIAGPFEFGNITGAGKRSDIDDFVKACDERELTEDELLREFGSIVAKYPQFVARCRKWKFEKSVQQVVFKPRDGWQVELVNYLETEPDPRKIRWFVDEVGNVGKSFFSRNYDRRRSYVITGGKHADIYYAYDYEPVIFIDLARTKEDQVPYEVMENFKNGYFLSTKYEVKRMKFNIPHVVVFSNFHPDQSKLSMDRWDIKIINN